MKPYRVAICFSGELRSWEFCAESILHFFNGNPPDGYDHVEVDYFASVWDDIRIFHDLDNYNNLTPCYKTYKLDKDEFTKFENYYSIKKMEVLEKTISDTHKSLFAGANRSFMLKREYEIENDMEYNLVVKCRTDVVFPWPETFNYHNIETMSCYSSSIDVAASEYYVHNVNDVMYYADSPTMDIIGHTTRWLIHQDITSRTVFDSGYARILGPGTSMFRFLQTQGINAVCTNSIIEIDGHIPAAFPYQHKELIVRPDAEIFNFKTEREKIRNVYSSMYAPVPLKPLMLIFDLDGVLYNSHLVHQSALQKSIQKYTDITDFNLPYLDTDRGINTIERLDLLQEEFSLTDPVIHSILNHKRYLTREYLKNITIDESKIEMLEYLKGKTIIACASNSQRSTMEFILQSLKIYKYFDFIVSGYDVPNPKPYPDVIYSCLDYGKRNTDGWFDINNTLIIEDSLDGLKAAIASPSQVIKVNSAEDVTINLFKERGMFDNNN